MWKPLLLLAMVAAFALAAEDFTGCKVFRVEPNSEADRETIANMEGKEEYSFWTSIDAPTVDIMTSPEAAENFANQFETSNVEIIIEDVQAVINTERPNKPRAIAKNDMDWKNFYTHAQINDWLKALEIKFPKIVTVIKKVGRSFEKREILGVHVSFNKSNENNSIFIESGVHGREWITVTTTTYQLNDILHSTDPEFRAAVERFDWYIFPIFNPDGYSYTMTNNRMWRKNRQPQPADKNNVRCIGTDINRNWPYAWNNTANPCSDSYAGPSALSAVETKNLHRYINEEIGSKLVGFVSFHAYSQMILYPYGDSIEPRDNYDQMDSVGQKMVESIKAVNGNEYTAGNLMKNLYTATGNDVDWVKSTFKTPITYFWELPDKGKWCFLTPAEEIIPIAKETQAGLIRMLNEFAILLGL